MYIYLVFSKTGTWLSRVLNLFIDTKYVHVSLSLHEDLNTMYSFGRINPNNPFSGGFAEEDINGGVYKKNKNSECIVYKIEVTDEQYHTLVNEIDKFKIYRNSFRYNFLGLFAAGMNIPVKRDKHYFCSEFVSELLIKINVLNSKYSPELVGPTDLMEIEDKEVIFEGFTCQYGYASTTTV